LKLKKINHHYFKIFSFHELKCMICILITTPWLWSTSELYGPSNRRLLAKLVPTFCGYRVSYEQCGGSLWLCFLDRSHYFFFQVAPNLYSWGWVDPTPDPLLLRRSGSARNLTRTSGSIARISWPLDYRGSGLEKL
jgi:hypothetical protein